MLFEALENGTRLGITFVMQHPEKHESVNTFFTGVSPEARGRGIAIALKAAQALHMADLGVPSIYTQNMVGNEPILATNRTMGFVRDSGYVDVLVPL
jgi:predicted GNAT superfamily acetyltransferase